MSALKRERLPVAPRTSEQEVRKVFDLAVLREERALQFVEGNMAEGVLQSHHGDLCLRTRRTNAMECGFRRSVSPAECTRCVTLAKPGNGNVNSVGLHALEFLDRRRCRRRPARPVWRCRF